MRQQLIGALLLLTMMVIVPVAGIADQSPPVPASAAVQAEKPLPQWRSVPDPEFIQTGWGMIQGLAICLGIFFVGIKVWMHLRGKGVGFDTKRRLRVMERTMIAPKTSLVLVEFDGKPILITVGAHGVTQLEEPILDHSAEPALNLVNSADVYKAVG